MPPCQEGARVTSIVLAAPLVATLASHSFASTGTLPGMDTLHAMGTLLPQHRYATKTPMP